MCPQVASLKAEFSKKTSEAETLKISVDKAESVLSSARQLLDGLRGEKVRWEITVGTLGEQLKELPLSSLLAAAFITYLPSHPEEHRLKVTKVSAAGLVGGVVHYPVSAPVIRMNGNCGPSHATTGVRPCSLVTPIPVAGLVCVPGRGRVRCDPLPELRERDAQVEG